MNPKNQITMKKILLFTLLILLTSALVAQKNLPEMFHHSNNQLKPGLYKATAQDGMVKMDSMVSMFNMGEGFQEFFIAKYTYNDNGLLTQLIEHEADPETGEMTPANRYNYYYDGENPLVYMNYDWDTISNDWKHEDSTIFTYTGGLMTQEDYFWYDETNSEWDHDFITYYYYTSSVLDSVIETQWNGSSYDPNELIKYSYVNGKIAEEIIQFHDGDQWVNGYKTIYTWDGEKLTEYLEMSYDQGLSQWINSSKYTYTWETNGNLNEEIDYEWNTDLEQWEEMTKLDPIYDNTVVRDDMVLPFQEGEEGNPLLFFEHKVDTAVMYSQEQVKAWQEMAKMIFHYSEFVGINETIQSKNLTFQVYPNPASTQITLKTNAENPVNAAIYDATGRVVKELVIVNSTNVNIQNLSQGVYFIHFNKGSNTLKTKKFIVQ